MLAHEILRLWGAWIFIATFSGAFLAGAQRKKYQKIWYALSAWFVDSNLLLQFVCVCFIYWNIFFKYFFNNFFFWIFFLYIHTYIYIMDLFFSVIFFILN